MRRKRRKNPPDAVDLLLLGVVAVGGYMIYRAVKTPAPRAASPAVTPEQAGRAVASVGSGMLDSLLGMFGLGKKGEVNAVAKGVARAAAMGARQPFFSVKDSLGAQRCFDTASGSEVDTVKCMQAGDPSFLAGVAGCRGCP